MKKIFFFTLFLISFFFNTNISNAQDNIAFIDLNIVFDNSNAGKKINKQVTDKKKKNSKNFNELKKKFDADRDKLIAQKNVISPEEYEKKLIELDSNLKKYNAKIKKENNELNQYQLKVRKKFFENIRPILEDYAKKNSIDVILKKENILIGKTTLDISKDILDLFNKKIKTISVE
tara:strand:+ start:1105 stop:1632 length:528 start_codon:yes stop_codon:yes gene_type:complete